jgi:hypothetical protein
MPIKILAGIVLLATLAAATPPPLLPRIILPGEGVTELFWLMAPNIGVVTIRSARAAGPDVEVTPGGLVVHLVEVDGEVENVIQGDLVPGPVRFYFFTNTLRPDSYTTPLSWFLPGHRYAVFLREDGGVLRTMADLTEPNIRVRSGHHGPNSAMGLISAGRDPGAVIAALGLTPSADREGGFAAGIEDTYDRLLGFASSGELARLLRKLLTHPDRAIREWACLVLSKHYYYTDPCFESLLESGDAEIRRQANLWAPEKHASERGLPARLKEDPTSLSISKRVEDLSGDLELFTFDRDADVRRQACDALHRLFPACSYPSCPLSGGHGATKQ